MKKRFRFHRPSPALGVSLVALFVALSGGAYAATAIPNNSVGNAQLKNNSVDNLQLQNNSVGIAKMKASSVGTAQLKSQAVINTKIALGAVGYARINQSQVQRRVTGTCKTGQAIIAVAQNGTVTCATTTPATTTTTTGSGEYNSAFPGTSVSLTPAAAGANAIAATVASYQLAAGSSYFVQAAPQLTVKPDAGASITATCTLAITPGGLATSTAKSTTFDAGTAQTTGSTVPLSLAVASQSAPVNVTLTCAANYEGTTAPSVSAQGAIFGLSTSGATTVTTPAS